MSERVMNELSSQKQAVLSCRNLGKRYEQGPESVEVLSGLQLELFPGQRVAIVGSSGSGKSTLLNLLGGLDTPSEGSVWLAGEELSALNERIVGCCATAHWASSISSITCLPSSPRWRTFACRC